MESKELFVFAHEIRKRIVTSIFEKGGGHIGGSLSVADLIAVLYGKVLKYDPCNPDWEDRDFLICSKGHAGPAIYSALALKGFFPLDWLHELNKEGSHLPGHCDRIKVPGIDATTGSLGQGLSIACGVAMGLKLQNKVNQFVYCITGDGETAEGQIWEAAAFAAHNNLDNLIVFLDWNKKQIDGTNDEVMSLGDIRLKYEAFGWNSVIIPGNDVGRISESIQLMKNDRAKPHMIILDTIKGAGVPNIEKIDNNHCIGISPEVYSVAMGYLDRTEIRN